MNGTDSLTQRLARNLELIRAARGMDMRSFTNESGVSRQVLSLWKRGKRKATVDMIDRAAQGLGVDAALLLESEPSEVLRGEG